MTASMAIVSAAAFADVAVAGEAELRLRDDAIERLRGRLR